MDKRSQKPYASAALPVQTHRAASVSGVGSAAPTRRFEAELAPYRKQDDTTPEYTLESYQYHNAFNRMLFEKLNTRILNLGTYVKREFKKLYIAYKADTSFVDICYPELAAPAWPSI